MPDADPAATGFERALDALDRIDDLIDERWERLRGIPLIDRVFYTASEAGFTFGTVGGNAGVVEVRTR